MRAFIAISCLVLAVSAAPQGYTYNPPTNGLSLSLLPPASSSSFPAVSLEPIHLLLNILFDNTQNFIGIAFLISIISPFHRLHPLLNIAAHLA